MKCIFIEGLPGSGKTTFAKKLYKDLKDLKISVHFFTEGDAHPIDLAWIAIFNEKELISLYDQYPSLVPSIQKELIKEEDKYLLAYTKIEINQETKGFYDYCEGFEIYQVSDLDQFLDTHLRRYQSFVNAHYLEDDIYIFECVLIQNHINELLINYRVNQDQIHEYFNKLLRPFRDIDIQIIYIKQNQIENTLKRVTDQRRTNDKSLYKDWIDHVIDYVERNIKYTGYEGVLEFFNDRQKSELELLKFITRQVEIVALGENYPQTYQELKGKMLKKFTY